MKTNDWYLSIASKAHEAFQKQPNLDWDFPAYGGNLSQKEIDALSIEHVDAIQQAIGAAQERAQHGQKTTLSCFKNDVKEAYETITPKSSRRPGKP